jgi:1-deoxy-D-xylulose-5-phosphate reductoisomerase
MLNFNSDKNDLNVKKLIITASGGPFLNYNNKQLENVTISDAIKHPRWNMGHKISVDSATLMNKALELIEAHHLFGMKVDAIIHPQSVVHAILEIENVDKAESKSFAFLSQPDMRLHIAHSISHENYLSWGEDELNIENLQFDFQDIDRNRFPFIEMAHDIINNDAHLATIFNLAGEIVVDLFLRGRIRFVEIVSYVHKIFNNYSDIKKFNSIEEIMSTDYEIRTRCIEDFAGVI